MTVPKKLSRRWRLYAMLVVCSALPLLLFLYASDRFLRTTQTKNLFQQSGIASDLAARVVEGRTADGKASLESLAADPGLLDAWKRQDLSRVAEYLREAHELKGEVASYAIYDVNGKLLGSSPAGTDKSRTSAASSPWFTAVMQGHKSYVSSLEPTAAGPAPGAITIAAPLNPAHPTGIITALYTIDTVKGWMNGIPSSMLKWTSVVDQNGTILAGADLGISGPLPNANSHPEVKQVLAGQSGSEFILQNGRQTLVVRHPLSSLGWGILVEIPAQEIDKAFWNFERPIALIGLFFIALAVVIGAVIASLYRRLRESEQQVREIVTAAIDGFIAIDEKGLVIDWNPQAEKLFGWSRIEAMGQLLQTMIVPPRYREAHRRGMQNFLATGSGPVLDRRVELSAMHRDGHEFPVEISITHVRRDGKNYFNAFLNDISTRKQAEQEIADLNTELQARVSELETRNKALEAFSYSVSHDVRAPLRNIAGLATILREDCGKELSAAGMDYIQRIQGNVVRMQRLVDDLLRFARLGEQGLRLQKTDLNEVVRETIAGLSQGLNGRDVRFEVSYLPIVECDRGLIIQVFWNLLENALKFTRTRQHAMITIGQYAQGDEDVLFVRDNGVGFDMKQASKMFEAFQRLHRNDEFEGTGVGLATVHRIIMMHHGRIWANSELDRGATFYFSIQPPKAESRPTEIPEHVTKSA